MSAEDEFIPDWRWASADGSRELDRLLDRRLTFREKLEWLDEAEALSLRLAAVRGSRFEAEAADAADHSPSAER